MKKLLLGTTALAGALMLSGTGPAMAADPMTLAISGFFEGVVIAGDDDISGSRNLSFQAWNSEIIFKAKGVTDGGLTYGFTVEVEGITTADQIDEAVLYFQGGFGKLELGSQDGVADQMKYISPAPEPSGIINLNDPDYFPNNPGGVVGLVNKPATWLKTTGDQVKANYFTPRIAGFQAGATFTPFKCEDAACFATTTTGGFAPEAAVGGGPAGAFDYRYEYEAAVNYTNRFGIVTVGGDIAFSQAKVKGGDPTKSDEEGYSAGLTLAVPAGPGKVTVGGSYAAFRDLGLVKTADLDSFDLGVNYVTGPWSGGVQYLHTEFDRPTGTADQESWAVAVGGGYALAPGLALAAGYLHYDRSIDGGVDQNANLFLLGTEFTF